MGRFAKLAFLSALCLATSCQQESSAALADGVAEVFSIDTIFTQLTSNAPSMSALRTKSQADLAALGAMSFSTAYSAMLKRTSNATYRVGNSNFSHLRDKIVAVEATYKSQSELYGSVKEAWAAEGMELTATPTRAALSATIKALAVNLNQLDEASLGLASSSCNGQGQSVTVPKNCFALLWLIPIGSGCEAGKSVAAQNVCRDKSGNAVATNGAGTAAAAKNGGAGAYPLCTNGSNTGGGYGWQPGLKGPNGGSCKVPSSGSSSN